MSPTGTGSCSVETTPSTNSCPVGTKTAITFDKDLASIQEVRNLANAAASAQKEFSSFSQEQVDQICEAMVSACVENAQRLGAMAVQETTYGVAAHKYEKNMLASKILWESIKDQKTCGIIERDETNKVYTVGTSVGVLAGFTPCTNPTATAMFKILIAVKARNAMIISPHPTALKCTCETVRLMAEAGEAHGMPKGLVSALSLVTMQALSALMKTPQVNMLIATGGAQVVKEAHSSGKAAIGVGPGNTPVYCDSTCDVRETARLVVDSKSFDCSTICATEQCIVAHKDIAAQLKKEMQSFGAHFMTTEEAKKVGDILFMPNGLMNPKAVGKTPEVLAQMSGATTIPSTARILVGEISEYGNHVPISKEKLTTVLGFMTVDNAEQGIKLSKELLEFGGAGHTMSIHANDHSLVERMGCELPACRILINTMSTLGSVGFTTHLQPSMTLATGGFGGGVFSDNISVRHVLHMKRIAYGTSKWGNASRD